MLYYLTTSLNFNNIFSSESISPESFYSKRGFGFSHYENIVPNIKNHIVLSKRPYSTNTEFHNLESYEILFEFHDFAGLIETDDKDIYLCNSTIHLNRTLLKGVYFKGEAELKKTLAKAESSRNVKFVKKYLDRIKTSMPDMLMDLSERNIFEPVVTTAELNNRIVNDEVVNCFKGLCYCYELGDQFRQSKPTFELEEKMQKITNDFALLKNEMGLEGKKSYKKKYKYENNQSDERLKQLKYSLDTSIRNAELFFKSSITTYENGEFVSDYLKQRFGNGIKTGLTDELCTLIISVVKSLRAFNALEGDAIKWQLDKGQNSPSLFFYAIKSNIDSYYKTENLHFRNDLDSDILKLLFELKNKAADIVRAKTESTARIKIHPFRFIAPSFIKVSDSVTINSEVEQLINIVFKFRKRTREKITDEQLLPMVEEVGNRLFKEGTGKKSQLYKYLSHEIASYEEPPKINLVFKNFAAFALNPNDLDRLTQYLNSKGVENSHVAFSLFGLFNGVASLPYTLFSSIITLENADAMDATDAEVSAIQEMSIILDETTPHNTFVQESEVNYSLRDVSEKEAEILDFDKIALELVANAKWNIKKLPDEFEEKISQAIAIIRDEVMEFKIPAKSQKQFLQKKLLEILTSTHKMKKFGEKSVQKVVDLLF